MVYLDQQKILRRIWLGTFGSLVLYLVIPFLVPARSPADDATAPDLLRLVFWGLSFVNLGVLWWRRQSDAEQRTARNEPEDRGAEMSALVRNVTHRAIAISLAGSIAVYGLCLALLRGYLLDQYLLTLLSGLCLWRLRPPPRSQSSS